MPRPPSFFAADYLYTHELRVDHLAAALEIGDGLYITRVLTTLAESMGLDDEGDQLAVLLRGAKRLGYVRMTQGRQS